MKKKLIFIILIIIGVSIFIYNNIQAETNDYITLNELAEKSYSDVSALNWIEYINASSSCEYSNAQCLHTTVCADDSTVYGNLQLKLILDIDINGEAIVYYKDNGSIKDKKLDLSEDDKKKMIELAYTSYMGEQLKSSYSPAGTPGSIAVGYPFKYIFFQKSLNQVIYNQTGININLNVIEEDYSYYMPNGCYSNGEQVAAFKSYDNIINDQSNNRYKARLMFYFNNHSDGPQDRVIMWGKQVQEPNITINKYALGEDERAKKDTDWRKDHPVAKNYNEDVTYEIDIYNSADYEIQVDFSDTYDNEGLEYIDGTVTPISILNASWASGPTVQPNFEPKKGKISGKINIPAGNYANIFITLKTKVIKEENKVFENEATYTYGTKKGNSSDYVKILTPKLSIDKYVTSIQQSDDSDEDIKTFTTKQEIKGRSGKTDAQKNPKENVSGNADEVKVAPDDYIVYTIKIENDGDGKASNVKFEDTFDSDFLAVGFIGNLIVEADSSIFSETDKLQYDSSSHKLTGTIKKIGAHKTVTIKIRLKARSVDKETTAKNTASFKTTYQSGSSSDWVTINYPELSIEKYVTQYTVGTGNSLNDIPTIDGNNARTISAGSTESWKELNPVQVNSKETVIYNIVITNTGKGIAKNVKFYDIFDFNNLEILDSNFNNLANTVSIDKNSSWTSTGNPKYYEDTAIVGVIESIGAGKSVTITLKLNTRPVYNTTTAKNTAYYQWTDDNENDIIGESSDWVKIVGPKLGINKYITKTTVEGEISGRDKLEERLKNSSPVKVNIGEEITYTILLSNTGEGDAFDVNFIDEFDANGLELLEDKDFKKSVKLTDENNQTLSWKKDSLILNRPDTIGKPKFRIEGTIPEIEHNKEVKVTITLKSRMPYGGTKFENRAQCKVGTSNSSWSFDYIEIMTPELTIDKYISKVEYADGTYKLLQDSNGKYERAGKTDNDKKNDAVEIGPGNFVTYDIVITNNGEGWANNINFSDKYNIEKTRLFGDIIVFIINNSNTSDLTGSNGREVSFSKIKSKETIRIQMKVPIKENVYADAGTLFENNATIKANNANWAYDPNGEKILLSEFVYETSSDYVKMTPITINKCVYKITYPYDYVYGHPTDLIIFDGGNERGKKTEGEKENVPVAITPGCEMIYCIQVNAGVSSKFSIYDKYQDGLIYKGGRQAISNSYGSIDFVQDNALWKKETNAKNVYKTECIVGGSNNVDGNSYYIAFAVKDEIDYDKTYVEMIYENEAYIGEFESLRSSSEWVRIFYQKRPWELPTTDGASYKKYIVKVNGKDVADRSGYTNEEAAVKPITVKKGDKVTYRLQVTNTKDSLLKQIVVTDTMDNGLYYSGADKNNKFKHTFTDIQVNGSQYWDFEVTVTKSNMYLYLVENKMEITSGIYVEECLRSAVIEFEIESSGSHDHSYYGSDYTKEIVKKELPIHLNDTKYVNLGNKDYIQMDDIEIGGKVWIDGGADGIFKDKTGAPEGVVVKLYKVGNSTPIKTTTIKTAASTDGTTGDYSFGKIEKGATKYTNGNYSGVTRKYADGSGYNQYYVEFEYSGLKYISTPKYGTYEASSYFGTPKVSDSSNDWFEKNKDNYNQYYNKKNWFVQSHASEDLYGTNNRKDFNNTLETIAYNIAYKGKTGDATNTKTLAYTFSNHKSTIQSDLAALKIKSKSLDLFALDASGDTECIEDTEYLKHINLGLLKREEADLELTKDVVKAEVTVNGYQTTYVFDKLGNGNYTIANYHKINTPYQLHVYNEDYEYRTGNISNTTIRDAKIAANPYKSLGRDNDLNIILTYKVTVKNNSTDKNATVKGAKHDIILREVLDYSSSEMTFLNAKLNSINGTELTANNTSSYNKLSTSGSYSYDNYNTKFIANGTNGIGRIKQGESVDIYLTYRVNKDSNGYIVLDSKQATDLGKINIAEVSAYSVYDEGTSNTSGLIDWNSNPGNLNKDNGVTNLSDTSKYEDDTFQTSIKVGLKTTPPPGGGSEEEINIYRTISGNVWEEINKSSNTNTDGEKVGDGIKNGSDIGAANVIVKLYEVISIGEEEYLVDTGICCRTDSSGNYRFGGIGSNPSVQTMDDRNRLHAGRYIVRFIYGDEANNLVSSSEGKIIKYSGQDFKSTIYTDVQKKSGKTIGAIGNEDEVIEASRYNDVAGTGKVIYSVARDNEIRRLEVNSYSTTMVNATDNVLKATSDDEKKLLAANTSMYADTKKFDMQIEYYNNYSTNSSVAKYVSKSTITKDNHVIELTTTNYKYDVGNINFGITERPLTKLQMMSDVIEIKAITSDGNKLLDILYNVKYTQKADGTVLHETSLDKEHSTGFENVQFLKRDSVNQGFRYVNIDTDLLQGMTIIIKYRNAISNNSEIDHISKEVSDMITGDNYGIDLNIKYDNTNLTSATRNGNTLTEKIGEQTRTYKYDNSSLYKLSQDLKSGITSEVANYKGGASVGSSNVNTNYTYHNIAMANNGYTPGQYVGNIYYTGKISENDVKVKTRLDQYINYVDNDLIFKPEDNLSNGSSQYLTYTTKEIAEKGLLKGITNTTKVITDGSKDYYNEDTKTNNNLAFNIENSSLNSNLYKFLEARNVASSIIDDNNLYFIDLQASRVLTSEIDLDGIEIDNLAEIVKVTNTVGRKVYVSTSKNKAGFIGNTTEKISQTHSQPVITPLITLANAEIDTDFTEYVTFSPPTGLTESQAIINTVVNNTTNLLLIIIPVIIIIAGMSYVTVKVVKRKKFYK